MREGKNVRMKDIAAALGVSVVTVSNALSGKKGVSKETRKKVLALAKDCGYKIQPEEKTLRSMTAGVLIPGRFISVGTSFYWEMYQHTAFALSEEGVLTTLEILTDLSEDAPLPHCVRDGAIDSLIIIGRIDHAYLSRIMEKAPADTVMMDYYDSSFGCSAVLSDNRTGMYRAAKVLADHGHREIGFVGTPETSTNIADRYFGYRKCLWEAGIPVRPEWIVRDRTLDWQEHAGIRLPERLPTAFACSSDYAAGFLAQALEERGLSIPGDISVTSYDDYLYDRPLGKILTTFHVDLEQMAGEAVRLLKKGASGDNAPEAVYVDGPMAVRGSVKAI